MLWTRSKLLIFAGAVILLAGIIYGLNGENDATIQVDSSTIVAQRLQRTTELDLDSNLDSDIATVIFEQVDESGSETTTADCIELSQQPVKDNATAQSFDDSSFLPDEGQGRLEESGFQEQDLDDQISILQSHQPVDGLVDDTSNLEVDFDNDFQINPADSSSSRAEETEAQLEEAVLPTQLPVFRVASRTPYVKTSIPPTRFAIAEAVAHKAVHHIEYGKSLSRRAASFSARQEFFHALSLIAQAIDSQSADNYYSGALNNAVIAIREAEDFYAGGRDSQIGLNLVGVVETHSSRIISIEEARTLTPVNAIQRYFTYAEKQFAIAGGLNVVSAEALYCLGKLHTVMSKRDPNPDRLDIAKAIMFHRAALACDANNYRSANELGALFARNGQLADSKSMLKKSLIIQQTPQAWGNLAVVHKRLGELHLAEMARTEYEISVQQPTPASVPNSIQWVVPEQFNEGAPLEYHESTARLPKSRQPNTVQPVEKDDQSGPQKLMKKIKSWF